MSVRTHLNNSFIKLRNFTDFLTIKAIYSTRNMYNNTVEIYKMQPYYRSVLREIVFKFLSNRKKYDCTNQTEFHLIHIYKESTIIFLPILREGKNYYCEFILQRA